MQSGESQGTRDLETLELSGLKDGSSPIFGNSQGPQGCGFWYFDLDRVGELGLEFIRFLFVC